MTPTDLPVYNYIMTPSALLSTLCSSLVIYHIFASRRNQASPRRRGGGQRTSQATATFHRLLLGLCFYDVLSSSALFWEPFTQPDLPQLIGHWTCTASGFLKVLGFSCASVYNAGLSLFSFLIVCRNWRDQALSRYFEPVVHLVIAGISIFCALGMSWQVYNPSINAGCWAGTYPQGCMADDSTDCLRGDPMAPIVEQTASGGLILVMIILVVAHAAIFCTVHRQERRLRKYELKNSDATAATNSSRSYHTANPQPSSTASVSFQWNTPSATASQLMNASSSHPNNNTPHKKDSKIRKVAAQSVLYCAGFLGAYLVALVHTLATGGVQHYNAPWYPPVRILQEIMFPLQGFFNMLVYMRPKYLQWRRALLEDDDKSSRWQALQRTLSAKDFTVYRQAMLTAKRSKARSIPMNVPTDHSNHQDFTSVSFAPLAPIHDEEGSSGRCDGESWANEEDVLAMPPGPMHETKSWKEDDGHSSIGSEMEDEQWQGSVSPPPPTNDNPHETDVNEQDCREQDQGGSNIQINCI